MLTEKQLRDRKKGIGGSDAAAILGMSVFKDKTPLSVYFSKVDEEFDNSINAERAFWGNIDEPAIADKYQQETGYDLQVCNETKIHKTLPFILGNFDYQIVNSNNLMDCKVTESYQLKKYEEQEVVLPDDYLFQALHYMSITDGEWLDFAVRIGAFGFKIIRVERDRELENNYLKMAEFFWKEHIEKRIPPSPQSSTDLRLLYPIDNNQSIEASPEILETISTLKTKKKLIKELEAEKNELEVTIKSYMRDCSTLIHENKSIVTYKSDKKWRESFDLKTFKSDHPDLYQKYSKTSAPIRRFLVK